MANPVFEMFAKLTLDKSEYNQGMNEAEHEGSSFTDRLKKGFGTIAKGVAAGVGAATTAVVSLTKAATDGFANYEQLKGGVETLFKDSASTVMEYANQAYKTAGLSANEYMETTTSFAASLIQSVGGNVNTAAEVANRAVIDMSDNANKMGTDMEAIQSAYMGFSKQNYTMLDNLKLGYGGTKQEMERLIADASKMKEEQGALNVTVEEGNMSFANIVNAISVMQAHLDIAGTTAKEAGTTIQGSASAMKAAWDNLLVGMADDTQDMGTLIQNFVDSAITLLEDNLIPRIQTVLQGIGEFVTRAVDALGSQLPAIIQALLPPLLEAATSLFTSVAQAIPSLLNIILQQLPMVVDAVVGVVPMIVDGLLGVLPTVLDVGVQIILSLISGIGQSIPQLIPTALNAVMTLLETFYNSVPSVIDAGLKLILGLVQGVLNAIPQMVARLPQVINAMVNYFMQSVPMIVNAGVKLLTALVQNLPQIIRSIVAVLPQIINSAVQFFVGAISEIAQAGITLFVALIQSLPQIINTIVAALPQIISAICETFASNIPAIIDAGVQLFTALVENLPVIIATIVSVIPDIIEGIVSTFGSFVSSMWDIGKNLVKGIWEGISKTTDWLLSKLKGWVNDAIGWIADFLGIHSPSTVMRDRIGRMMGLGVAEGIEDSIGDVEDASGKLLGAIPVSADRDFSLNIKRNLTDSYTRGMEIVIDKVDSMMREFQQTVVINLDDREFGRAVRGYA